MWTGEWVNLIAPTSVGKSSVTDAWMIDWSLNSPYRQAVMSYEAGAEDYGVKVSSLATGKAIFKIEGKENRIKFIDDNAEIIDKLLITEDGLPRFDFIESLPTSVEKLKKQIMYLIKIRNIRVLWIDPILDLLAIAKGSKADYDDIILFFENVRTNYHVTIMSILHTRKSLSSGGNGSDGDGGGDSGSGDNGGGGSGGRTLVAYWSSSDAMQENTISRNGVVHINNTEQVDVPISKKYTNNIKAQLAYLDEIAMGLHTPPIRDGFGFATKFKGLSRSFGYAINVRYPNTAKLLRVPVKSMSKMNGDRYKPNYMLPDYAFCPAEGDPFIGITSKDANGLPIYPGILSIDGYPVGNSFIHNSFASSFGTYTTIDKDELGDDYIVIDTLEYVNLKGEKVFTYNCLVGDAAYNECQSIYRKMDKIPLLEESISTELRYRAESQSTYPKLTDFNFSLDYPLAYSHSMFAGVHLCYSVAAVYETNATLGNYTKPTAKCLAANIVHFALYPTFVEV